MEQEHDQSRHDALHRLNQTLLQIDPHVLPPYPNLSVVSGPLHPPLQQLTLSQLLHQQAQRYSEREVVVVSWTGARWSYSKLWEESSLLARSLLQYGIRPLDRVGIMSGNCERYIALFFACARVGAICVTLNNTYTAVEAEYALKHTRCKILFTTPVIARFDNSPLLERLRHNHLPSSLPELRTVCLIRDHDAGFIGYKEFISQSEHIPEHILKIFDGIVSPHDVANLQFTSGSTGSPKAAMLTHHNLVNNSNFIGNRMNLTPEDVLCCPPPLFHCFGLTLGLLATINHGGKIVYPAESFDAEATMHAISDERCTALHGVPAMMESIINTQKPPGWTSYLRTGIVAGSPVPRWLMERMVDDLGMTDFTSSYGLTEASPTVFNAHTTDSLHTRLTTVGTALPHARVKIVNHEDKVVPIGVRGELCVAGYQLCRGYWENPGKTDELLVRDEYGELWLHTGDEAVIDVDGYCTITGRFKDIIIRGGENIYPLEIEERLVQHPAISQAIVVGVSHPRYVEVPSAFLSLDQGAQKPSLDEVKNWVRKVLGRHKAPVNIFWLGEDCDAEIPLTGSGKIKKFLMRDVAEQLMEKLATSA